MRQPTEANAIDSGRGDRGDASERDATRGLQQHTGGLLIPGGDRLGELTVGHVVEQHHVGPPLEGVLQLFQRVNLNLDEHSRIAAISSDRDGRRDVPGIAKAGQVVVLDQDRVKEAHPVIGASAACDSVLGQVSPAG